jgi:superfamily II DNA or RNA helicase
MLTDYHAKYYAYDLTRRCPSDSVEKLVSALSDAQVDLNPHQIEAALFAFRSPFSRGAILADEVGLGKTIEAGLLLSQKWAEGKRKLLIVVPSNLRKQWSQELADKFFLPSIILENKSFNQDIRNGNLNPFSQDKIVICSYQFVKTKDPYIKQTPWDLVVIDEAHRLRNVYKPTNKIANSIKNATANFQKVLLTATPLQNSILELYGLVSLIDDYAFGDLKSFKAQYARLNGDDDFLSLKERLKPLCKRTLRKQVLEYVPYTNRHAILQEFYPTEEENRLYELVSDYLQQPTLYALPASQRKLMTLILRKLLASSTHAIVGTLKGLADKLDDITQFATAPAPDVMNTVAENYEEAEELLDEWDDDEDSPHHKPEKSYTAAELREIEAEKQSLLAFHRLANAIIRNSKGEVLLTALRRGFKAAEEAQKEKGASRLQAKAIIFTESRRTQEYLQRILADTEFAGKTVLFNGTNNDHQSNRIYREWMERYTGTDRVTGSPTADKRAALVEYFRDEAQIMISTEAAAEGINLQFCNLVVNYDMPWNPQRIEQRIGRCHRYGQKFDVIVVNFLNKSNAADVRVYELLAEKFKLFDGVFGASDEVLGAIESGVDFEKRISQIFQTCRTVGQIQQEFDDLQRAMEDSVHTTRQDAREKLLNNFDQEVIEKVRIESQNCLNRFEERLWTLTRHALHGFARFDEQRKSFVLERNPFAGERINPGPYRMAKMVEDANTYRIGHPLAQRVLARVRDVATAPRHVTFQLRGSGRNIAALDSLAGRSGWLRCQLQTFAALEAEDHILFGAITDDGVTLDDNQCRRLFDLPGETGAAVTVPAAIAHTLGTLTTRAAAAVSERLEGRNAAWFDEEMTKLEAWAEDKRAALRLSLKELDEEIAEKRKSIRRTGTMPEKLGLQRQLQKLEQQRDEAWRAYDAAARQVQADKDRLLTDIEARLQQQVSGVELFTIRFEVV